MKPLIVSQGGETTDKEFGKISILQTIQLTSLAARSMEWSSKDGAKAYTKR
jgi:hypothetical protein